MRSPSVCAPLHSAEASMRGNVAMSPNALGHQMFPDTITQPTSSPQSLNLCWLTCTFFIVRKCESSRYHGLCRLICTNPVRDLQALPMSPLMAPSCHSMIARSKTPVSLCTDDIPASHQPPTFTHLGQPQRASSSLTIESHKAILQTSSSVGK